MAKAEHREQALPDAAARRAIAGQLGHSLLVEAAAGTGKTTSLVARMTALIRTGTTTVDRLSAVTFTIKAAAELSERFQASLEAAARAATGEERDRLDAALSRLDSAFVGTIHAFCARLLRERPVEAGVDPGFAEMDEPENAAARAEAWDRYTERLFTGESPALPRLAALGVRLADLRQTYETLSDNEDVAPAIGAEEPPPDFSAERAAVEAFLARAAAALPTEMPEGGWSDFQEAVRRAMRLCALRDPSDAPAFAQVLDALARAKKKATEAGRLRGEFESLVAGTLEPGLQRWRVFLHPILLRAIAPASDDYAAWRRRNGRLNFQDLLLLARDLLRDHPLVRRAFQGRFLPLLVDEFQDTDPIQAEILFYLTGADVKEKDWRKLEPLPGSLFVVGDPKQSIYRFRRADIETYAAVRRRLERFGKVLNLSANFRGTGRLCDWINGVFSREFPADATAEQAAWVPLEAQRPEGAPGVFRLLTRTPTASAGPVVEQDSERIAGAIAAAIGRQERAAGDFLVLFRTRKHMADYARALERRDIPYELSGGGAFKDSEELQTLLPLLGAISDPDDPVPFTAVLRGPLCGVDDEALYRHARAGGRFSFRATLPEGADPRIAKACALLSEGEHFAATLPPGAAIARLCGRLGWTAYSASRELADSRAGNLLKAIAAARTFSADGLDFAAVVAELDRLATEGYIEEMGARPGRPGAVRLMTLHGAKGLEAPVVFLADPRRESNRPTRFWIDRSGARAEGHWRVIRETDGFGVVDIAEPRGWTGMAQIERAFDDAERKRLLYVAATRARDMLVVSVWKQGRSENAQGPWAPLDPFLKAELPEAPAPPSDRPAPRMSGLPAELEAFAARRRERRAASGAATYAVVPVTDVAHAGQPRPGWERTGRGMSWGRVMHGVLEALMRDPKLDIAASAANLLAEEERSAGELDEVLRVVEGVRGSELWTRALAARRRLVEVPFALEVPRSELGRSEGPDSVLLQGAIDLVFEDEAGWVLVDYKSDTVGDDLDGLVAFYTPQVSVYRRYWERLTGQPTRAGLFFIQDGREVWLAPS
ncbi:MAG TPA: UvrD-helicase domain-containing protein [Thermoanaerobaculia bacterium]|jgi:ATP-dependent helicase/nuclease subunit A